MPREIAFFDKRIRPDFVQHFGFADEFSLIFDQQIIFRENNGSTQVRIRAGGALAIAVLGTAGSTSLCRNASNEISTCSSSIRYKSNINTVSFGLNLVKKLRPVSFNWKEGSNTDLRLVAEEVAEVEPLLTTKNEKGETEGVKYDRVGVMLVNAVNEQQTQIEAQQKQINEQKEVIQRQQAELDALKQLVCSQNPHAQICRPKNKKRWDDELNGGDGTLMLN
ncbi:MAG: tail fiber domain-containing protein [Pyrinomonadaceae bacterium]